MEIIIHQAILHVLDTTLDAPVLSGSCMEPTAEKTAYLQNHIEKLLASDDIRQCRPLPDSAFKNELEHNQDFVDLSCRIAGVLFDYMHAHTTIPGADLAVVDFTRDGAPWLGILKLNYKNGYTHYTETVEGAPVNSIIQQRACLPTQSGKVEEGALVNLQDYSMRLLEKKYDIDGHKEFYLSTVVFQYTQAEPEKKKLKAIQEAAAQAVMDAYQDEPHAEAQVAMLIANQAADNDNQVSVEQVRRQLDATKENYRTSLEITAKDRINFIMDVSTVLSSTKTHVSSMNARSTPDGFALLSLDIDVHDGEQLQTVMRRLEQISGVMRVTRPAG